VVLTTGSLNLVPNESPTIALDDDAWKYRRTVYTNRALAGLLHCFHPPLAHIVDLNWQVGHVYSADEFLHLLTHAHLEVTYDRPMSLPSVTRRRACRLSIYLPSDRDGCLRQVLIPVKDVDYRDQVATYHFRDDCVERELRHSCKSLKHPVDVELILHGGMILDDKGRALDAELIDGQFPTGNGVQGGEFVVYFKVRP
jgi:hypothetical protein